MSRFEELCAAFKASQDEFSDYQRRSLDFAEKLFTGLWEYLQIPSKNYHYFSLGEEREPGAYFSLAGVVKLGNDGYWNLGFDVTVHEGETLSSLTMIFEVRFKQEDGKFHLRIGSEDSGRKIDPHSDSDFEEFYEFFFTAIREYVEAIGRPWEAEKPRPLGFKVA